MWLIVKLNGEIPRDSTGSFYVFSSEGKAQEWIDEMESTNAQAGGKPIGLMTVRCNGQEPFFCGGCERPFLSLAHVTRHMERAIVTGEA